MVMLRGHDIGDTRMNHMALCRQALAPLRRKGVCQWVEADELLSAGCVAILEAEVTDEALAVVIARRAMCKVIDKNRVRQAGRVEVREGHAFSCGGEEPSVGDMWDATIHGGQHLQPVRAHVDLWEGMRCLTPQQYRVVMLAFWGGKTQVEIAAEIGIGQQHVSRILASAQNILRDVCVNRKPQRMTNMRGKEPSASERMPASRSYFAE